jgi:hypothetical protein
MPTIHPESSLILLVNPVLDLHSAGEFRLVGPSALLPRFMGTHPEWLRRPQPANLSRRNRIGAKPKDQIPRSVRSKRASLNTEPIAKGQELSPGCGLEASFKGALRKSSAKIAAMKRRELLGSLSTASKI